MFEYPIKMQMIQNRLQNSFFLWYFANDYYIHENCVNIYRIVKKYFWCFTGY